MVVGVSDILLTYLENRKTAPPAIGQKYTKIQKVLRGKLALLTQLDLDTELELDQRFVGSSLPVSFSERCRASA